MRGCLFTVLLGALVLALLAWFGLPPAASWLVTRALAPAVSAGALDATVVTSFPPGLLRLHADEIRVTGSAVTFQAGFSARTVDLDLRDVDLVTKRVGSVSGSLAGVVIESADGITAREVALAGPPGALVATITVDAAAAIPLVVAAFAPTIAVTPSEVSFAAPDLVHARLPMGLVTAHLAVRDGALVALPVAGSPVGEAIVVAAGSTPPVRLTGVTVTGPTVVLTGLLDASALGIPAPGG